MLLQMLKQLRCRNKILELDKPLIMGILNLTPDSFFDGGYYKNEKEILSRTEVMLNEGADIIDIGAVSTRPGAVEVEKDIEYQRLIPAIKKISREFPEAVLSVDTYRSTIARDAIDAGANIINDISGGLFDPKMFQTIAELQIPYILMHIKGKPKDMQVNPKYMDVLSEVVDFFRQQLLKLSHFGVTENIVLDPGFGFGKSLEDNYRLLKDLPSLKELGYPILTGVSRKSMINKIIDTKPTESLNGTTAIHTLALLNGANLLRVHDVKEAVEVRKLMNFYNGLP